MKLIVFLALGLVAATMATPALEANLRMRRDVATTTQRSACSSGGGLGGLLAQLGNLLGNLLDNIGSVLLTGDSSVISILVRLLSQVQSLLNSLLTGNLSDGQANAVQTQLSGLLSSIANLLNDLLGGNQGSNWVCNTPTGVLGRLIAGLLSGVSGLTGSWSNDGGLLTGVIKLVLQLVGSILALLI